MILTIERKELLTQANRYVEQKMNQVNPQYRHHYHLMAPVGWINDPNGFVYYQGAYHLFYQYYPYDSQWGPMYWGHAKSIDLLHWEHLPIALAPDQPYDKDGCFSGSAIEKDGKLYLMYTGHVVTDGATFQTQCIAVSEDGIHFEKVAANPVIDGEVLGEHGSKHDFRDPKVFLHDGRYYTVVATKNQQDHGRILLFSSSDLLDWQFVSVMLEGDDQQGIMWECPDFFHLDGKDVLILSPIQIKKQGYQYHNISSTMACVGEMDWRTGKLVVESYQEIDFGLDFYAPQTLEDDKKQRIMVAWMQMWNRTLPSHDLGHGWAGAMTLPRELHVKEGRLVQKPISNIYSELEYQYGFENIEVGQHHVAFRKLIEDNTYMNLVADLADAQKFEIQFAKSKLQGLSLSYDCQNQLFNVSRKNFGHPIVGDEKEMLTQRSVPVPLVANQLVLEIFRDTSSIEIFVNGQETMTVTFYETEKGKDVAFLASGKAMIRSFEIGRVKR